MCKTFIITEAKGHDNMQTEIPNCTSDQRGDTATHLANVREEQAIAL